MPDAREELLRELTDLFAVKLALVLVSTHRALKMGRHDDLASAIEGLVSNLEAHLEDLLAGYNITRQS